MTDSFWQNERIFQHGWQDICSDECAISNPDQSVSGGENLSLTGGSAPVRASYEFGEVRRLYLFGGMAVMAGEIDGAIVSKYDYPEIHEKAEACAERIRSGLCSRFEAIREACGTTACGEIHLKALRKQE